MLGADASTDAAQRLRRSSHETEQGSALTKIKEFQRDTIIEEVLSTYAGVIPVGKEAMQVILSPGSEKEEHHHEEAMNSASHAHFAQYIDDIVPDELSAVGETGQASFSNQLSNLRTRLSNVRLAQMGLPTGGDILDGIIAHSISEIQNDDQWTAQTNGSILDKYLRKAVDQKAIDARNGFFAQFSASFTEDHLQQMDGDSYGLTLGVDQQLSESFTFGIMGGIGKADSSGSGIEIDTDSLFAGIYGNWLSGDTFIDGYFSIGFHDTETTRKENSGAVLSSSPNSNQYTASLTFGKVLEYESFLITPTIGFTYDQFKTGDYTESVITQSSNGVPSSASQVFENSDYSLLSSMGLKIAHFHYQPEGNVLIPELRASWEHDFDDDPTSQKVRMLSHNEPYTIDGRREDTDYGFIGTGITSLNQNGRTVYLHYDYMIGKSDFDAHFLNLGFRILF
jgi:outer membrane autotransporter protein